MKRISALVCLLKRTRVEVTRVFMDCCFMIPVIVLYSLCILDREATPENLVHLPCGLGKWSQRETDTFNNTVLLPYHNHMWETVMQAFSFLLLEQRKSYAQATILNTYLSTRDLSVYQSVEFNFKFCTLSEIV